MKPKQQGPQVLEYWRTEKIIPTTRRETLSTAIQR